MFHFRKNVFPTPTGGGRSNCHNNNNNNNNGTTTTTSKTQPSKNHNTMPSSSSQVPRTPSSIHYNLVSPPTASSISPLQEMLLPANKNNTNKHETAAQIRQRKVQEYKAKKWAQKYETDYNSMNTALVTPTPSFDEGADTSSNNNNNKKNRNSTNTPPQITRARTTDDSNDNENYDQLEILRTGSDGLLIMRPNATLDDRAAAMSRARANQLSELYIIHHPDDDDDDDDDQDDYEKNNNNKIANDQRSIFRPLNNNNNNNNNTTSKATNKYEMAAQIRQRKKQEYKAKKKQAQAMNLLQNVITVSQSFEDTNHSNNTIHEGIETSLRQCKSYDYDDRRLEEKTMIRNDSNTNNNNNNVMSIEQSRSDGVLLQNPSFEERVKITRARADQLGALYAKTQQVQHDKNDDDDDDDDDDNMKLNKNAIFPQSVPPPTATGATTTGSSSIAAALSGGVAAQKWAQERQDEARRMKKGGVYVGQQQQQQVTPTSSFDMMSADFTSNHRSKSFDHHHHSPQNGYLAANGKIYNVPSLC